MKRNDPIIRVLLDRPQSCIREFLAQTLRELGQWNTLLFEVPHPALNQIHSGLSGLDADKKVAMIAQPKIDHERKGRELKYFARRPPNHQRRDLRDYFTDCLIVHFSVQETNIKPAGCRRIARRTCAPPADACAPGKRKRRKPEPSPLMILPAPCAKSRAARPCHLIADDDGFGKAIVDSPAVRSDQGIGADQNQSQCEDVTERALHRLAPGWNQPSPSVDGSQGKNSHRQGLPG